MLLQVLLAGEEFPAVLALDGLAVVSIFGNLDQIFVCGQGLLLDLILGP